MHAALQGTGGGWMNRLTVRTECRVCGSTGLDLILDYGSMPLAGGFLAGEGDKPQGPYPLRLFRCPQCTLMQVVDVVAPDLVFRHYSYASSTTRTLREHFAYMGPEIVERAGAAGQLAVEFGCNDGVLMRPLIQAGAKAVGVDPSDVALHASLEQGWPLIPQYFTADVGRQIAARYGRAHLVVGVNVLAHADDLHDIMRGVEALLADEGHFVFEVHYQGDLISLVQYDTVYHEHLCYYSLRSLGELLRPHALRIAGVTHIPIHSGSVRVTAVRAESAYPESAEVGRMLEAEREWDVELFRSRVEARRAALRRLVLRLKAKGRRIAAYGAAGRVTILLNYCGLDGGLIDYVVDASPLRQGRYVPGVGVPIVAPARFHEEPPDYAIMTAWNYEAEIVSKEQAFLSNGGAFIVPLPEIRLRTH
jgi:novobiocin biosynthesis protein NovU/D-mycarose 3-C-methyltransferase